MDHLLFNGWQSLFRTLVVGVLAYATLIIFLRVSGKRTLSKMNAFAWRWPTGRSRLPC